MPGLGLDAPHPLEGARLHALVTFSLHAVLNHDARHDQNGLPKPSAKLWRCALVATYSGRRVRRRDRNRQKKSDSESPKKSTHASRFNKAAPPAFRAETERMSNRSRAPVRVRTASMQNIHPGAAASRLAGIGDERWGK